MAYISFAICILAGFAATTLLVITDHAYFAIAVLIATSFISIKTDAGSRGESG